MYKIDQAIVFLEQDELDDDTVKQIRTMASDPSVKDPRVMPDCHYGTGCCVGFTSKITDCTVPRYIGGDIGCGMACVRIDPRLAKKISKNLDRYYELLVSAVPIRRNRPVTTDLTDVCDRAQRAADAAAAMSSAQPVSCLLTPVYNSEWVKDMCKRVGMCEKKMLTQLGTLGSGNHFIEYGEAEANADSDWQGCYLSVHTGSRALGQAICNFHQGKIKDGQTYLQGTDANLYYYDMIFAQQYARTNREIILDQILLAWGAEKLDHAQVVESVHNYIDFEDQVWRKGAVRADQGQIIMIALNMRDGILLARGHGNAEWNNSAPHGAGRRVPRNKAHQYCNLKVFKSQMRDVFTKSICKETLDESPDMYKDPSLVKTRASQSCEIVAHIKPIINHKSTE